MKKAAKKKYAFQWNEGGIVVDRTRAVDPETAWENAIYMLRPASMRDASDDEVRKYLAEHGDVVKYG